jgi:hypothetical protein
VHIDDVPQVLHVLHSEHKRGGVEYTPEDLKLRKPFFAERDRAWVARAVGPDGQIRRKSLTVSHYELDMTSGVRLPYTRRRFLEEKSMTLRQIEKWQEDVEAGVCV